MQNEIYIVLTSHEATYRIESDLKTNIVSQNGTRLQIHIFVGMEMDLPYQPQLARFVIEQ
jgi:hypothetical protein